MITTTVHDRISVRQICKLQERFSPLVLEIERRLNLDSGSVVTMAISCAHKMNRLKTAPICFHIYVMSRCEIVSFEAEASMVTRIVARYDGSFEFRYPLTKALIPKVVAELKKQIAKSS